MSMATTPGLAPVPTVLDNGVRVLVKQTRMTPAVTISLAVGAGSVYDPDNLPGTAYFVSRVIDRGTTSRAAESIAETLDFCGVSLRVAVSRQTLTLGCDCLAEDFDVILALLAEMVRDAAYPETEVDTRRAEILTTIRQDADSPATTALDRLMALLYGASHPYGRLTKGSSESVTRLDRDHLRQFHRARIRPSETSLVVVGDVAPDDAVDAATRVFGEWVGDGLSGEDQPLAAPPVVTARQRVVVPMMNKSQADIAYGFTTITRTDPLFHTYQLMANIFGQYGMGGRLGASIRERQGMAYYAICGFEAGLVPGPLVVRAGVNASNVDRALVSIDTEVTNLAQQGVTDDELSDSKRYIIGSLPRTLETNAGIAAFLQNIQQFDLGLDYDRTLPDLISGVTRDAVNSAARDTLASDRAAIVVAGPYQDTAGE